MKRRRNWPVEVGARMDDLMSRKFQKSSVESVAPKKRVVTKVANLAIVCYLLQIVCLISYIYYLPSTEATLFHLNNNNIINNNKNQHIPAGDEASPEAQASFGFFQNSNQEEGDELPIRKLNQAFNTATDHAIVRNDDKHFVVELLKMLHEQYSSGVNVIQPATKVEDESGSDINADTSSGSKESSNIADKKEDRIITVQASNRQSTMMNQLLAAISADGDVRRLIDWVQNSFNLASIGELTTQLVVSKLGSVNCAALLKPDSEETLVPRFLLFNEHFVDVPFELTISPSPTECLSHGKFDPMKKTVVIIHGYLAGYTLVDGLTNIKNRILDLNKIVQVKANRVIMEAANNNGTYVLADDLELKVRQQQYNVIIVDWFNGANPKPRSRYIRAAVNAQVVGQLIARFLSALVVQCRTPASNIQIIAHSLGKCPYLSFRIFMNEKCCLINTKTLFDTILRLSCRWIHR